MENILSNKGLTSSEANHVTNITKELVKGLESKSTKMVIFTDRIVLSNGEEAPLDENSRNENWVSDIKRIGELYSLSAWLKSAVKHKDYLLGVTPYEVAQSAEMEPLLPLPSRPDTSFNEYLMTLNTKELNDYYSNESVASHIGKFVHNFDNLRDISEKFRPTSLQQIGSEVKTIKSKRLYSQKELFDGFFTLQKEHREAEKQVNYYKANHKNWEKEQLDLYMEEYSRINSLNASIQDRNRVKRDAVNAENLSRERQARQEISQMKILIPNDLQPTLDYVMEYAKK